MAKNRLSAKERKIFGRKVKTLRKEGVLPGNVYGKKFKSLAIELSKKDFEQLFSVTGETSIIDLTIGKKIRPVLVHNVQTDPVTDEPIHVDFLQVDLKQKVTANIPLELVGEAPAEKQGLGTLVQYFDEIEVEALPADLPEKFEVNVSGLTEIDQAIYVKDLKAGDKVEVKKDPEEIIVKIEPMREEEEELPPTPTEGEEGAVEGEEKPAEEAPEGEEKAEAPEGEETKKEEK